MAIWSKPDSQARQPFLDGDRLLTCLHICLQSFHGQTSGVVERICQEMSNASQGLVAIQLVRQHAAPETTIPADLRYDPVPIALAGRWYGALIMKADPIQSNQSALSFAMSRNVAHYCALTFYHLEVTALLQGMMPRREITPEPLTRREQEILELLCSGYDRKLIAETLNISPGTLGKHFENIYRHIGVNTQRDVILVAFALGRYYPLKELTPHVLLEGAAPDANPDYQP
jgi:DNA-binding CsgD family transcriptional regulator